MQSLSPAGSIAEAFATLDKATHRDRHLTVRVLLRDGTRVEGEVRSALDPGLGLILAPGERAVPAADIWMIEVAQLRMVHKLAIALAAIVGGTGALVAYALLPWVNLERTDWPEVFGVVAVAGAVLWKALMSRTRVRAWMTEWLPIYEVRG